jgi:hypothetical protein
MKTDKAERRDKRRNKRMHGMRVDGASVRLIQRIQRSKADKILSKRRKQE